MKRNDIQKMLNHPAVETWAEFCTEFSFWQENSRPSDKTANGKERLDNMVELAICMAGDRLDKTDKRRYRNAFDRRHRDFLKKYRTKPDIQAANPNGRYAYAFDECCKLLIQWIEQLNVF